MLLKLINLNFFSKIQKNVCFDVKCMKATHCPAGSICKDNKCEKQECIGHAMCLAKKGCEGGNCLCRSRKCVKFECTKNTQCKDGCICQENSKNILDSDLTVILILSKNLELRL